MAQAKRETIAQVRNERDKAVKELAEFRKKVTKVTADMIDKYGLAVCDDGLEDWANELGIEAPTNRTVIVRVEVEVNVPWGETERETMDDMAERLLYNGAVSHDGFEDLTVVDVSPE